MEQRSGYYQQQPGGYSTFVPAPLPPEPPVHLGDAGQVLLSEADRALARLDGIGYVLPSVDLFVSAYMKKEAVQSSQIEGTQSTLLDLFNFEAGAKPAKGFADIQEVTNYLDAMGYGLQRLDELPLASRLIRELHKILMTGIRGGQHTPGEFRQIQNYIGAGGASIAEARYVPPEPAVMLDAVAALEGFIHNDIPMQPLVKCALIHYQFEAIHPFLDGNGRIGRMLITLYLCWSGVLRKPLLYLSRFLNKNRLEYQDRLSAVSDKGEYEQWVSFFLRGVKEVSDDAAVKAEQIVRLRRDDMEKIATAGMTGKSAALLLNQLFDTPITSVPEVAKRFEISRQAATELVGKFERLGILEETTGASRNRRFAYAAYLKLVTP